MAKVKLDGKLYEIPTLRCAGEDDLLAALLAMDRVSRPWAYALDAAEAAGVEVPPVKDRARHAEALAPFLPREATASPAEQHAICVRFMRLALARGPSPLPADAPVPGTVEDRWAIAAALWGRSGDPEGKA